MKTFGSRRIFGVCVVVALIVVIYIVNEVLAVSLRPASAFSGWLLLGLMVLLALYNVRKKLTFLPLGASSTWLQLHLYVGLLTIFLFALHLDFRWPAGLFEVVLAFLYVVVAGSGLLGIYITRFFPSRLNACGEEVIFERIPLFISDLREEAEDLVVKGVADANSTTVGDFYTRRLQSFFARPRHFWRHVLSTSPPRQGLLASIESQYRYLDKDEKATLKELEGLVCVKDDLDHQYALQAALKWWLFVHIPFTYALLIFVGAHILLVHAFAGS
jgi:hypothetical protein